MPACFPTYAWPAKYPDEVQNYAVDWTARLEGETITSCTPTVTTGSAIINSHGVTGAVLTIWIRGGDAGETCIVTCEAVTSGGRTLEIPVALPII